MSKYSDMVDVLQTDIKRLIDNTGDTMMDISVRYGIPYRTVQEWCAGRRHPADYVVRLLAYAMSSDYGEIINYIF